MTGRKLAHLSLRLDAVYCVVIGLALLASSPALAPATDIPAMAIAVVGGATAVWGGFVWALSSGRRLRASALLVMIANISASLVVVLASTAAATPLLTVALIAISVDVGAFALSQGVALRRMAVARG